MFSNYKKIIFFILVALIILPPFFDGGRNIFVDKIALIFIAVAFLFFWLDKKNKNEYLIKNLWQPPFIFLIIFLFLSLITVFFSTSPYNSFVEWFQYLSYGILFFVVAKSKFEKKEIDILIKTFLGVSTVLCLIGLYFYLTGGYSRITATFYWPNPFAGYLLYSLPLGLSWFLIRAKKEKKILLPGLIMVILVTSFILTGSRGAFISLAAGFFVYFFVANKNIIKHYKKVICIILLSVFLVSVLYFFKEDNYLLLARLKESEKEMDISSNARLNYWQGAWDIFKDYPLTGSGPGTFGTIYHQYQKDPISSGKYAHNLYLEILSESGIFVLILFIVFLASIYWIKFKDLNKYEYALPLYVGTLAFLIHNGVDVDWHFSANTLVFWMFLGLLYNEYGEYKKISFDIFKKDRKRGLINGLLIILSLVIIFIGFVFLCSSYNFNKGLKYQSKNELALAEKYYKKSIFLNLNPKYLRQYGIILYIRGLDSSDKKRNELLNKAFKISQKTIKLDLYNALNYELRGKILEAQNKFFEAENNFKKTIDLNKFNPRYYINLSMLLIKQDKKEEASEIINKILFYYTEQIVQNREMIIMKDQGITTGVKREIDYLKYLLSIL